MFARPMIPRSPSAVTVGADAPSTSPSSGASNLALYVFAAAGVGLYLWTTRNPADQRRAETTRDYGG